MPVECSRLTQHTCVHTCKHTTPAGWAWERGAPDWHDLDPLVEDEQLRIDPRARAMLAVFRFSVAYPIKHDGHVIAVLAFYGLSSNAGDQAPGET